ncbi:large ribosomal subunit protein mL51 [Neocloeon triangulifer]|uniref:large ribosomal subunit protein mL51 n=1 Tax=Neocloeon triangulifer TaxID=2078957 RepID=UPI00286F8432|nr:large ribosomal subunit protein mL51 [Neocloeon triangulifer]
MNCLTKLCSNSLSLVSAFHRVCVQAVRNKSMTKLVPPPRPRHGYCIRLHKGLLPRLPDEKRRLPMPEYRPSDAWAPKRALFGQNDYIDILGNENIHPVSLQYHIPFYARGMRGNEFRMLLHKRKMLQSTDFALRRPKKWQDLNKRIRYIRRWMNQKTQTGMTSQY